MHPCFIKKSLLPGVCKLIVCLCVSWQIDEKDGMGWTAAYRAADGGDAELLAVSFSLCVCFVRMLCLECTHCLYVGVPRS